jgi:hypothetical protein
MAIWNLFFSTILLPLIAIALLWRRPRRPWGPWITTLIMAAGICGFSILAAPWGWFGIPVRALLTMLFFAALVFSIRRPPAEEPRGESPLRVMVKVLIGLFFGGVAIGVVAAHGVPDGAVGMEFPLRDGAYLVQHGGSESAANMHVRDPKQRFGVDLVKLNAAGYRARGIYPRELSRYEIYGVEIVSPCDGTVVSTVDGLPDNIPGVVDEKNTAGNHVVLRCGDLDVLLAHMKQGSVAVVPKAAVRRGTRLGLVGNSGNTTEPHLHVHAERGGNAVPVRFDGKWLVRNAIVRK